MMMVLSVVSLLSVYWISDSKSDYSTDRPRIAEVIPNVTVPVNRDAVLPCVVYSLGNHKVGWVNLTNQTVLTVERRVITENSRVRLTHDERKVWNLHIKKVKETDRGCYMCQINTKPLTQRIGCIDVQTPPSIMDEGTTSDLIVKEGNNITLRCSVRGHPKPRVVWKKDNSLKTVLNIAGRKMNIEKWEGEILPLTSVTRYHIGSYQCIANNDVPPAVAKRMQLDVHFVPQVSISFKPLHAPEEDVVLHCMVQAYPSARVHWTYISVEKTPLPLIMNSSSWKIFETYHLYHVNVTLQVRRSEWPLEGEYSCIAMNLLGQAEKIVGASDVPVGKRRWTSSDEDRHQPAFTTASMRQDSKMTDLDSTYIFGRPYFDHVGFDDRNPPLPGKTSSAPTNFAASEFAIFVSIFHLIC